MYNKVELCGVDTAGLPVLSEEEKRALLTAARAGDRAARRRMIEGNLRLVLSVVQKFSQRGENLDDLFQVGCIGLIKAIDHFDPALEVRFSTYGVPMIVGEIRRFLRDNNAVRVSRSMRDTAYRAMQAREQLEKSLGREPTLDETTATAATPCISWTRCGTPTGKKAGSAPWSSARRCRACPSGSAGSWSCATCWARPRWRWPGRSASARPRSAAWKKAPCSSSGTEHRASAPAVPL